MSLVKDGNILVAFCLLALGFAAQICTAEVSIDNLKYLNYKYESKVVTFADSLAKPTGFKLSAGIKLEPLYVEPGSFLFRISLDKPEFYKIIPPATTTTTQQQLLNNYENLQFSPKPLVINSPLQNYHLYAHATLANRTVNIKQVYTHPKDSTTFKNIKKSVLLNLLPTQNHLLNLHNTQTSGDNLVQSQQHSHDRHVHLDNNTHQQPELFSPDLFSRVKLSVKPLLPETENDSNTSNSKSASLLLFRFVSGIQNVSFGSRVYKQATSNITTSFELSLEQKEYSSQPISSNYLSLQQAISAEIEDSKTSYEKDVIDLQRERRICSQHHCEHSLAKLYEAYKENLSEEMLAKVEAGIAQLRLQSTLRSSFTSLNDITKLLKSATISKKTRGRSDLQSSFLDILANARTKDSIAAAIKHLKLPTNQDLNVAERFLTTLSVSAKTSAKMRQQRPINSPYSLQMTKSLQFSRDAKEQRSKLASNEYIARLLMKIVKKTPAVSWESEKLRWSTLLTLATLVNARNIEQDLDQQQTSLDSLNEEVSSILIEELETCQSGLEGTDCRIVVLQAIGNLGILHQSQFEVLRDHVLYSGGRESISSMKVLRDLLQNCKGKHLSLSFFSGLKELLIRIVYDKTHETTSRILAAEMIVRFLPDSLASEQVLLHLPLFGNNELATMIYLRMSSLNPQALRTTQQENWYWYSSIINGTSASFIRTMAKTDSLNASYGVNVELLNNGKMLKESSFDLFLDTSDKIQDLFSLGIFARGLSSFAGGSTSEDSGKTDDESATVGMTLRILGGYLRPYVFFNGISQLLSHIWSGTASEPMTVFNGNLLLIDHDEAYPLISGFVVEQEMRGILSIDVSGKISISMWHKNSHSKVATKASVIVHATQSIFTSFDDFWDSHFFSFGGEALVDFVSDTDFYKKPFKICLQVMQPEFKIR